MEVSEVNTAATIVSSLGNCPCLSQDRVSFLVGAMREWSHIFYSSAGFSSILPISGGCGSNGLWFLRRKEASGGKKGDMQTLLRDFVLFQGSRWQAEQWGGSGPSHMACPSLLFIVSGLGKKCDGGGSVEALAKITLHQTW